MAVIRVTDHKESARGRCWFLPADDREPEAPMSGSESPNGHAFRASRPIGTVSRWAGLANAAVGSHGPARLLRAA